MTDSSEDDIVEKVVERAAERQSPPLSSLPFVALA